MRYNIFNRAHLPLKTALLTGCISISKMIVEGAPSITEVFKEVEEVLQIYHAEITYEALHILPLIFEYEPSIWNNYTTSHAKGNELAEKLKDLVESYFRREASEDKFTTMNLLSENYNRFLLFNFNRMDDDEAVLNEILWRYYPDNILLQIERQIGILPHLVKQHEQRTGFKIATAA